VTDRITTHIRTQRPGHAVRWQTGLLFSVPVTLLVLGWFYYWFAMADRYFIFLYYHDMGSVVPDTSPFSPVTSSRYWMAGLVASGIILTLYTAANWLLGRLSDSHHPPDWWRVWMLSAVPLVIGIPIITMSVNDPVLPPANAAQATAATLAGLCLALLPGEMAARRPAELFWLALDGLGLMLILVTVSGLQNLPRWLASGGTLWLLLLMLVLLATGVWLIVVTGLRLLFRTLLPNATTLFLAGLTLAYVLMPLAHHVLGTDGQFYITNSNNFFADYVSLQLLIWLVVFGLAWVLTRLRQSVAGWRMARLMRAL
jgi:hypothetical protein